MIALKIMFYVCKELTGCFHIYKLTDGELSDLVVFHAFFWPVFE